MRIMGKNYDNKAMMWGAGLLGLALVVPTVSEPLINFFCGIRDKVSGMIKK